MRYNSRYGTKMYGQPSVQFGNAETTIQTQSIGLSVVIAAGTSSIHIDTLSNAFGNILAQGTSLIVIRSFGSAYSVANRIGQALALIQTFTSIDAIRKRYVASFAEIKTEIKLDGFLLAWKSEEIPCSDDWIETQKEPCNWSDITYAPRQWKQAHG